MKTYIQNNINFRIVSSNALAKFKLDQAFDFNEINQCKKSISTNAREIVLLEYDHWFKWLVRLEKVFLLLGDNESSEILKKKIELLLVSEMDEIKDTLEVYIEFFSRDLIKFVDAFHRDLLHALQRETAIILTEENMMCAYTKIVILVSDYLQQLLKGLIELEAAEAGKPFLSFTNGCETLCKNSNFCSVGTRGTYISNKYNINEFDLYNYTDKEIHQDCLSKMQQGFKIKKIISV